MKLIKAQFLNREGLPHGRHYTYIAGEHDVKVGDLVQLNADGDVGVVTEINVPEEEVEAFKDRLKPIICKLEFEKD